ncbi:MAG TPA: DUF3179 domain-containing protein [Sedimenticola sp.]|nr:DUF3179 domain-containing protein [Sedimenticola sp.]
MRTPCAGKRRFGSLLLLFSLVIQAADAGLRMNGFEIGDDALIPVSEIHAGGPDRDGIPAIDSPRFLPVSRAGEMEPDAPVLGLEMEGIAKAYPIAIMNWHEIVNDRFRDRPVVITYCPLCGSGVAYTASVSGLELSFGVSGLLYNSDVLLYDRQTGSLWSQMLSQAVSGPMRGTRLQMLPLRHTTWAGWLRQHPESLVLSRETGFSRDYDRDPYQGYMDEKGVWFPVAKKDPRYHPKERVIGLALGGRFKAYPLSELSRTQGRFQDRVAGRLVTVEFDRESGSARIRDAQGREIPTINAFWFAWYAFHPDTGVFQAP